MSNKPEKPADPTIALTASQLQEMLQTLQLNTIEAVKTFVEESKKPSAVDIAKKEAAKRHWQEVTKLNVEVKEAMMNACTHVHEDENKSLFGRADLCFPQNAVMIFCQRCQRKYHNFIPEEVEAFTYWIKFPALSGSLLN